jgi:hypothetical protein
LDLFWRATPARDEIHANSVITNNLESPVAGMSRIRDDLGAAFKQVPPVIKRPLHVITGLALVPSDLPVPAKEGTGTHPTHGIAPLKFMSDDLKTGILHAKGRQLLNNYEWQAF